MADYIDRNRLLKKKKYTFQIVGPPFSKHDWFLKLSDVLQAPAVDVVKVVRCEHCKHRDDFGRCSKDANRFVDDDFFCKWGEKE